MNRRGIWFMLITVFFLNSCLTIAEDRITNTKTLSDFYYRHSDGTLKRGIWYVEGEKLLIVFNWNPSETTRISARVIDTSPHKKLFIKELRYEIDGQTGVLFSGFYKDIPDMYISCDRNEDPLLDENKRNIYIASASFLLEEIKTREKIIIGRIDGEVKKMTLTKIFAFDDGPLETETSSYKIEIRSRKAYTKAAKDFFAWMRILTGQQSLFSQ
jgi:hypothetical protein